MSRWLPWWLRRSRGNSMVEETVERAAIPPAKGDPIRIVPVQTIDELASPAHGAAAPPPPHLTYRGGPLLTAVEVFTVFWGAAWSTPPESDLAGSLNGFFDFV